MRGGVVTLRIVAALRGYARNHRVESDGASYLSDRSHPAIHFLDFIHLNAPTLTHDFPSIRNLAAALCVERSLTQDDCHPAVGEIANRRWIRLYLDRIVANKFMCRFVIRASLPLRGIAKYLAVHGQATATALLLRTPTLLSERGFKARKINHKSALACHQLRQVDRESVSVVQSEGIFTGDGAANAARTMCARHRRHLVKTLHSLIHRGQESLFLCASSI